MKTKCNTPLISRDGNLFDGRDYLVAGRIFIIAGIWW